MSKHLAAALLLAVVSSARSETAIYDNFNDDDPAHLFDCCATLALQGSRQHVAIPFTPQVHGRVIGFDIALSLDSGRFTYFNVRLWDSDASGLPGQWLHSYEAHDVPPGGQCCAYEKVRVRIGSPGEPVRPGRTYWIEVFPQDSNVGGWNLNTLGISGPYVTLDKPGSWTPANGILPAVRVIVK